MNQGFLDTLVALTPVLVPAGIFLYHLLMAHLPAAKRAAIEREVTMLVTATEQTYKAVPGSGAYKKSQVLQLAAKLGLKVDPTLLDALIESAVANLPK